MAQASGRCLPGPALDFLCENCYIPAELVLSLASPDGSGFEYGCPLCGPEVELIEVEVPRFINVVNPLSGQTILDFEKVKRREHHRAFEIMAALSEKTRLGGGRSPHKWVLYKPAGFSRYHVMDQVDEEKVYALLEEVPWLSKLN